jgi:hypothetical protein
MTFAGLLRSVPRKPAEGALRGGVIAALAVDAVVHWRLAEGYGVAFPAGVGGEVVFRVQAVLAVLAAGLLLASGRRAAWVTAFLVLASAFAAVVLYRYVPVPQLGPLPGMYEPIWFRDKTVSAVAEGLGAVLAAVGATRSGRPRRSRTRV